MDGMDDMETTSVGQRSFSKRDRWRPLSFKSMTGQSWALSTECIAFFSDRGKQVQCATLARYLRAKDPSTRPTRVCIGGVHESLFNISMIIRKSQNDCFLNQLHGVIVIDMQ